MNEREIADCFLSVVLQVLAGWKATGVRFASIVEGDPRAWPAEMSAADVAAQAKLMGVEVLDISDTDAQVKIGEALLHAAAGHAEAVLAEHVAQGAPKA